MADYTALKAAIASVIKTNGNQEITGLLLQQTLHSMIDGVNTTKQDTISFVTQTVNKFLRDDNTFQEIPVPTGSFANNVYLSNVVSDISGYKTLNYVPDAGEVVVSTTIKASDGTKTIATYLYPAGLATTLVPSGTWSFLFNSYVTSAVGVTNIGIQCFIRTTGGAETNLFTIWSDAISNLSMKENKIPYSGQSYPCNLTDRMGIRVLLKSTSTPQLTLSYVLGNGYASYYNTPIAIRHKQLRDLNEDANFQHITTTQRDNFTTAYTDRMKWDGGSSGLVAATARTSLGLVIGTDVLAQRTFGSAANNNTGDFLAYNGTAVDSSKLGGQLPSYYQTNIAAGTTLQYYRGDKSWQTLNTSVVPENGYLYFNTSRVLATALTDYAVGSNAVLAATDTILAAFGKIQGQINNRALLGGALTQAFSVLSLNIEGTTLYKGDADFLKQLATMFVYESSTDSIKALKNFYSTSGVSAFGIGSGGGGGGGVNVIDNLTSTSAVDALSANMGRVLYGYINAKQPQLNGNGFVKISGTTISYDGNSYALSAHNHDWSTITSGKPTILSGYGISSSDTMFDGKYLSLSNGGTLSGALAVPASDRGFEVNSSGGISFCLNEINAGALGGTGSLYLGFRRTTQVYVRGYNIVIGTDNIGTYALPLSGGTITSGLGGLEIKRGGSTTSGIKYSNANGVLGYIGFLNTSTPVYIASDGVTTYPLIHSGNSNRTTIDWSAMNLTLAGSITGATTISASGVGRFEGGVYLGTDNSNSNPITFAYASNANSRRWRIKTDENSYGDFHIQQSTTQTGTTYTTMFSLTPAGVGIFASTVQATTAKLTNLTDGYIPYHISDGSGLGNSSLYYDGTNYGIGTTSPSQKLDVQGNIAIANYVLGGGKDYGNTANVDSATLQLYNGASGNTTLNNGSYGIDFQTGGASRVFIANSGIVSLSNTTQSTAYTNGALVLSGGLGIAKNLSSNGNAFFNGNISTNGYITPATSTGRAAGVYGLYDSSKISHIWGIGTAYKIAADGLSLGNLYGLISKYNTVGGNPHIGAVDMMSLVGNGVITMEFGYSTGQLWTSGYIESASYLKGTSVKIGSSWEAIPNGSNGLDLKYGGVIKATLSSSGDILAYGGVTCFVV